MEKEIAKITSLMADPIRTSMLWSMIDGRAYTGLELAIMADTSPQNASMHLAKLLNANLLAVEKQGRHKYYRLASDEVATAMEAIANLIPKEKTRQVVDDKDDHALKYCRTCYDHLAGKVAVTVVDAMVKQKLILKENQAFALSRKGEQFFTKLKVDLKKLEALRRPMLRPCLDWTERRHHLAGSLGAEFLKLILSADWIRRVKNSRAVVITAKGQKEFYEMLRVEV